MCNFNKPMKVEIRIFATKEVALDQFKKHFFGGKESFYLKDSETWLQNMLSLYQDSGLRPFQAIKVSLKMGLRKRISFNFTAIHSEQIDYQSSNNFILRQDLNRASRPGTTSCRSRRRPFLFIIKPWIKA